MAQSSYCGACGTARIGKGPPLYCARCWERVSTIHYGIYEKGLAGPAMAAAGAEPLYFAALAGVRTRAAVDARRRVIRCVFERLHRDQASRDEIASLMGVNTQTIARALDQPTDLRAHNGRR